MESNGLRRGAAPAFTEMIDPCQWDQIDSGRTLVEHHQSELIAGLNVFRIRLAPEEMRCWQANFLFNTPNRLDERYPHQEFTQKN